MLMNLESIFEIGPTVTLYVTIRRRNNYTIGSNHLGSCILCKHLRDVTLYGSGSSGLGA